MKIFIGYDSTQKISFDVLIYSIEQHREGRDFSIHGLNLKILEDRGFKRPHDPLQSTEFTYTRFLVPWLCGYEGISLFLDSDMLALGNLGELFDLDMESYALRVVKHYHRPKNKIKMDGKVQTSYPRKNWSSLMLMDCSKLKSWTKKNVESRSGAWLHRFEPISDEQIGEIDGTYWNRLDEYDNKTKLIHYTEGGPWLSGYKDHPYGNVWMEYKSKMMGNGFKTKDHVTFL